MIANWKFLLVSKRVAERGPARGPASTKKLQAIQAFSTLLRNGCLIGLKPTLRKKEQEKRGDAENAEERRVFYLERFQ